jgi:hypothetical protein
VADSGGASVIGVMVTEGLLTLNGLTPMPHTREDGPAC